MGKRPLMFIVILLLFACTSDPNLSGGPRLVQEVTVEPTLALPTREPSSTPVVIAVATSELTSPVPVATIEGRFPGYVLVTPTLPPSKTPTPTQTITPTFTQTRLPTVTVLPPLFPTLSAITSASNPAVNANQPCAANWFFSQPIAAVCPLAAAMTSSASYQQFQHGFMIWVGQQDAIYVVYDSQGLPRWQVFKDNYEDSTPEYDPSLVVSQPNYTWQPRRGFGSIWRDNPSLQERIGWAVREWEEPYNVRLQIGLDGSVFLADPSGGIIALRPGGQDWERYT
ncbi:MAG: hypothetical protein K8J31_05635 [Anaerolineae bacterium]|nr:hypothetical protein [Anaerolineae bacterium]